MQIISQYPDLYNFFLSLKRYRVDKEIFIILGSLFDILFGGILTWFGITGIYYIFTGGYDLWILIPICIPLLFGYSFLRKAYDHYQYYKFCKYSVERLTDTELRQLNSECRYAVTIGSGAVSESVFFSYTPYGPVIIPNQDVVWLYILNTTYRQGGFTTGSNNQIICCTADGKRHSLTTLTGDSEIEARTFFKNAYVLLNKSGHGDIIFGYTPALNKLFLKNPAGFKYSARGN